MIDGTYRIKIDALLGPNRGRVILRTKGDVLYADINAPVVGMQKVKGTVDGDTFVAKGSGWVFLLGKIIYDISGEVSGDDLILNIKSNRGNINLKGVRV